ncbi:CDP-alcohol phosphatidyltransferase [Gordonibacter sp. An230]|uniref:CDP-alcohol phosphatidyltransferase family protein n=1 Tax=Gordonibacter sp. An230 TaxID=1965592 RepID=UPI000B3AAE29|nr:CDP-alcohol phosphatidyltransferase family protein [Gordonibacter sp. An230]OUO91464.1 CDP-alcohol phosphatidyltransferase [Gordonibacter sp. An230]
MRGNGSKDGSQQVSDRILTLPNVISAVRLCLVPVFLVLLLDGHDLAATLLFAIAAGTDWVDGQIARRTNAVSRLGQLLDPAVDRILMIAGVTGLFLAGRLPLWIIFVVLVRDLLLLIGGAIALKRYHVRVPVVFPGKVATTLLFVGFAGLLLNWPLVPGLGIVDASWLPGLNEQACSWSIWFVYAGLALALATTIYYARTALLRIRAALRSEAEG